MDSSTRSDELCFTPDEALGLLDLIVTSAGEMSHEQRNAVMKLSEFCRTCLRERAGGEAATSINSTAAA